MDPVARDKYRICRKRNGCDAQILCADASLQRFQQFEVLYRGTIIIENHELI